MHLDEEKAALLQLYARSRQGNRGQDASEFPPMASQRYRIEDGAVIIQTRDELLPAIDAYLKQTQFHAYEEIVPPGVEVSGDDSMAWLIGHVRVRATQQRDGAASELAFRCSWVSIYTRHAGEWLEVVNASTFHEGHPGAGDGLEY
jgi:hypothetical protein